MSVRTVTFYAYPWSCMVYVACPLQGNSSNNDAMAIHQGFTISDIKNMKKIVGECFPVCFHLGILDASLLKQTADDKVAQRTVIDPKSLLRLDADR